jgi:hypothetical protein
MATEMQTVDPSSGGKAGDSDSAKASLVNSSASTVTTGAAASAAAAALGAKASALMDGAKALVGSADPIKVILCIVLAIALSAIIYLLVSKVNLKQNEINSTYTTPNNAINMLTTLVNPSVDVTTMPLRNFYIKTALNCCCLGEWKNNYVDTVALKSAIAQGYRCLDFEIYSEGNKPVVASSTKSSFYYKETYNSILFLDAMTTLSQNAFTKAPNVTDPLFINLRIKSNNTKIIPDIVTAINNQFGDRLLGADYNYLYGGNNLGRTPISDLMGKVIIIADLSNPMCTDKDLPLFQIINFGSNSPFLHLLQYEMGVKNTPDMSILIDYNKKNMSIVLPDDPFKENVNFNVASAFGCQFIGMMPQLEDINLEIYNKAFNDNGSAFILKPPELCYQAIVLETPPPQNPALSLAGRNYSTDYASWSV